MLFRSCVRSILSLWENFQTLDSNTSQIKIDAFPDSREMTLRQTRILELIKQGKTNAEIAVEIGFSDSLVKQETILIYKKLGVSGRKEIIQEHSLGA